MLNLKSFINSHKNIKLWVILDNIRSAYNVGAMFRTADGTGQTGLILLGITPDPKKYPLKIQKTALGAQNSVPFIYYKEVNSFLEDYNKLNFQNRLGALELTSRAQDLFLWYPEDMKTLESPYFVAVGHELLGVSSKLLVAADFHLFIPMNGYKESLNVAESASILMYEFYRKVHY